MGDKLKILILADRDEAPLQAVSESLPIALLPIAGRPIIDHLLSALADCGPSEVTICVPTGDTAIVEYLRTRTYPGLALCAVNGISKAPFDCLALRGDILPFPSGIRSAIAQARRPGPRPQRPELGIWHLDQGQLVPTHRYACVLSNNNDRMLPNLEAYHRICLAAERGELNDLVFGLNAAPLVERRRSDRQWPEPQIERRAQAIRANAETANPEPTFEIRPRADMAARESAATSWTRGDKAAHVRNADRRAFGPFAA